VLIAGDHHRPSATTPGSRCQAPPNPRPGQDVRSRVFRRSAPATALIWAAFVAPKSAARPIPGHRWCSSSSGSPAPSTSPRCTHPDRCHPRGRGCRCGRPGSDLRPRIPTAQRPVTPRCGRVPCARAARGGPCLGLPTGEETRNGPPRRGDGQSMVWSLADRCGLVLEYVPVLDDVAVLVDAESLDLRSPAPHEGWSALRGSTEASSSTCQTSIASISAAPPTAKAAIPRLSSRVG